MTQKDLLNQIKNEFEESYNSLITKKKSWYSNLKLYNNLDKTDESVSSSLFISSFNTILGILYSDKMLTRFVPTDKSDSDSVERLNKVAEFEYSEMDKATMYRYDSTFDSLFYQFAIIDMSKWDKTNKRVLPEVINPLVFGYDRYFDDPQDWRYYWKWITLPGHKLYKLQKAGKLLVNVKDIPSGMEQDLYSYKAEVEKSKKGDAPPMNSSSANGIYQILEINTTLPNGKRIKVWVDKGLSKIIAVDEKINQERWNIVIKQVMRVPHTNLSASKSDILEDKHRSFGAILNLINIKAKDWATPIYEYDVEKVQNPAVLSKRSINQHIAVERLGAIQPLNKDAPVDNPILSYLQLLREEAQTGIGLPSLIAEGKKMSATETAIRQQLSDVISSVDINLLIKSEVRFWSMWNDIMREKLGDNDKVRVNIEDPDGRYIVDEYTKEDIITSQPVSIMVTSSIGAEFKNLTDRRDLMTLFPLLQAVASGQQIKNFVRYFLLPKFSQDKRILGVIFPKSIDEIKAQQENRGLIRDEVMPIHENDNDEEHLAVHYMAEKKTPAVWAHIFAHEMQYANKKGRQEQEASRPQPSVVRHELDLPLTAGGRELTGSSESGLDNATPLLNNVAREVFSAGKEVVPKQSKKNNFNL